LSKKVAAAGVVAGLALVAGGVAFAYVTATGTGHGTGKVATSSAVTGKLTVTVSPCTTPTTLLPGETQSCGYTVHNTTKGQVKFTTNTVTLTRTGTTVVDSTGTPITGCTWGWFTISVFTQPTPSTLAATGTATGGVVHLTLNTSVTTTQNACLGAHPAFTVHVPA
jgi:hypothetical protein